MLACSLPIPPGAAGNAQRHPGLSLSAFFLLLFPTWRGTLEHPRRYSGARSALKAAHRPAGDRRPADAEGRPHHPRGRDGRTRPRRRPRRGPAESARHGDFARRHRDPGCPRTPVRLRGLPRLPGADEEPGRQRRRGAHSSGHKPIRRLPFRGHGEGGWRRVRRHSHHRGFGAGLPALFRAGSGHPNGLLVFFDGYAQDRVRRERRFRILGLRHGPLPRFRPARRDSPVRRRVLRGCSWVPHRR